LCNLLSELSHLLLKFYKGPINLMGLLKKNVSGVRRMALTSHS